MHYLYDETFEGFLTCVHRHYYMEKADGIFPIARYQTDLVTACQPVKTDAEKARAVYGAIAQKISAHDLERTYRVFRSNAENKESLLLSYLRLGFKYGPRIRLMHAHPVVSEVEKAERRVGNEVHRLCGLIRFSVTRSAASVAEEAKCGVSETRFVRAHDPQSAASAAAREILYAPIEPDNDVVEFLAPHFCDRFKNDPFIIHDKKRGKALVAFGKIRYVADFADESLLRDTEEEKAYRKLWRRYFDAIAIKERTNPKCQRNFMPVRYWKHITEVGERAPLF